MWDLSLLQIVPGIRIAAPRDAATLREELAEAVDVDDAPTVVRFPKGALPPEVAAVRRVDGVDVLREPARGQDAAVVPIDVPADAPAPAPADVLVVAVGALAGLGLEVADRLAAQGVEVTVVDPRWVVPVPAAVVALAARHRLVAVVEDGGRVGGIGTAVRDRLAEDGLPVPALTFGVPQRFLDHGTRAEVLEEVGLTPQEISRSVVETVARLQAHLGAEVDVDVDVDVDR